MQEERIIVVIPAFNEAPRIARVLGELARALPGARAVVVDDGSADATGAAARAAGATVLRHPFNLGYGAALQTGYKYALTTDAGRLVQMDADGQHDPAQVPRLLAPIARGEADLVVGSRFLEDSGYRMGPLRSLGRKLFTAVARLAGLSVTDPTSGFQAMDRAVLELYAGDFFPWDFPDVDVLLLAHRRGLRIAEVPVRMSAGERPSTLHKSLRAAVYYAYKMILSLAAVSREPRRGT